MCVTTKAYFVTQKRCGALQFSTTFLCILAGSDFLLCQKQTEAKNDFHQYHKAHCQSTQEPLGNTPGDTGERALLSQFLLPFPSVK